METPPSTTWTPNHLQDYLITHQIPAEIVHMETPTLTVPAAAEALGISVESIVKTVIFLVDDAPYAVLANGTRRVDYRKLAAHFGVNRKRIKLADGTAVIALTGYEPGAVPPFGHRQSFPFLMQPDICNQEVVYAGGGGTSALLRVRSEDLLRLTQVQLVDMLSVENPI